MAGLPKDHDWEEAMQMASINMDSRLSIIENLMTDNYGGIAMNQEDLMNQLLGTVNLAGSSPLAYDDIQRIKEMMEDATKGTRIDGVRIDAPVLGDTASIRKPRTPPGGLGFPGTSGAVGSTGVSRVGVDAGVIDTIIAIRNKLDDFLDGSNILLKVMNPQTIREMVREMRHEIRELKRDHGISELAIIEHLEKELDVETDNQADWRTTESYSKGRRFPGKDIGSYSEDVDIPF